MSGENNASPFSGDVIKAGLVLVAAIALAVLQNLGLVEGSMIKRVSGFALGVMLLLTGNSIPKRIAPLSEMKCEPSRSQSLHRFAGWTFVLLGIANMLAWSSLSIPVATLVVFASLAGILLVLGRCWLARRASTMESHTS